MSYVSERPNLAADQLGTKLINELYEMIGERDTPLRVVMYTKDDVFDDVPLRAWWVHGNFAFDHAKHPERSEMIFDIPDEVWRRVQSRYATKVKHRFFGSTNDSHLPEAIRTTTDETRELKPHPYNRPGFRVDLIDCNDWPTFRAAVRATANSVDRPDSYTSALIKLYRGYEAFARINEEHQRIEIYIGDIISEIVSNWQVALQKKLGIS